jgi:hypothetical protein
VRRGLKPIAPKAQITLRVDGDVLAWFKAQGRGYQTRINALLRAYMDACGQPHSRHTTPSRGTHTGRRAAR